MAEKTEKSDQEMPELAEAAASLGDEVPDTSTDDSSGSDDIFEDLFDAVEGDQWGPKFRKVTLTPALENSAVQFIKEHGALWDRRHPKYCNVNVKRELWSQLGELCGKSAKDIKTWWLCLRDLYVRTSVAFHPNKPEARSAKAVWMQEKLSFMDDMMLHRPVKK